MRKSSTDLHWDQRAITEGDDARVNIHDTVQRDLELEFVFSHLPSSGRILEVGCGNGYVTQQLRARIEHVDAFDFSENMIERARSVYGERNNRFFHGSVIEPTTCATNTYAAAVCVRVLINLRDLRDQAIALANIARWLRPGGKLVLVEGFRDGFSTLNRLRRDVELPDITPAPINFYSALADLEPFIDSQFDVVARFHTGMFDFLTRIIYPRLVGPDQVDTAGEFHHKIETVARRFNPPDMEPLARVRGFALVKRDQPPLRNEIAQGAARSARPASATTGGSSQMKVLVTGGSGLVGSTVVDLLLDRGDEVVAIDNFATGRRDNLKPHPRLCLIEDSIADGRILNGLFGDFRPDVVIHAAASYKNPDDWQADALTNAVGSANIARASKDHKVARLIYFQTALCYGTKPREQPITLTHPLDPVNSSYAISKTAGEHFIQLSGVDWIIFRLANVVGPRNVSGPLPIFFERLSQGKRCFVTEARRDFVFVHDLARIVVTAADGTGNGIYHFSSGLDVAIKDLYDSVVRAMKLNDYPNPEIRPLGPDDAPTILLDPSRTFRDFGDMSFTPLDEIVAQTVAYYREFGVQGGYTHLQTEKNS